MTHFVRSLVARNALLVQDLTRPEVPAKWEDFAYPFAFAHDQLTRTVNRAEQRQPLDPDTAGQLAEHRVKLFFDKRLLEKYRKLAASPEFPRLPPDAQRLIHAELSSFESASVVSDPSKFIDATSRLARKVAELLNRDAYTEPEEAIREVLRLRRTVAHLCGAKTFAHEALKRHVLNRPERVLAFMSKLQDILRPCLQRELEGLDIHSGVDIKTACRQARGKRFGATFEQIASSLPVTATLAETLSQLLDSLFGLRLVRGATTPSVAGAESWSVVDAGDHLIGYLYLDLHAQAPKDSPWLGRMAPDIRWDERSRPIPSALVQCRFERPVSGTLRHLEHEELRILLHEFGHALHHLLTDPANLGPDRAQNVEGDVVEVPSKLFEEFVWSSETLSLISGGALSRDVYEALCAFRQQYRSVEMASDVCDALFGLHLHLDYDPDGSKTPLELLNEIRAQVFGRAMPLNYLPDDLVDIFTSHYVVSAYGYLYAEVLATDLFGSFKNDGVLSRGVGEHFRKEVLSVGSSRPFLQSFIAFQGREPNLRVLPATLPAH